MSLNTLAQNDALSDSDIHIPSISFLPSTVTPSTEYTHFFTTLPSLLPLNHTPSKNATGYTSSSGRACHSFTSGMILSVILLTKLGDTSTP
jgi:hypothetical protein